MRLPTSFNRRKLLQGAAALATAASLPAADGAKLQLKAPPKGKIPVAILLGENSTMIDFAGPWEVFQDVMIEGRGGGGMEDMHPFELYTVSDSTAMLHTTFGMKVLPDHNFETAPQPKVVVMGAQGGHTQAKIEWIKKVYPQADLVMSVCTGAFLLAKTGLLDGLSATTHHDFYESLEKRHPAVKVQRNLRYVVASPKIASAGGLTSGVDLALHVVDSYFGRAVAEKTAAYMEYQSKNWIG